MSASAKPAANAAPRDSYTELAFQIFVGMASRIYSVPSASGQGKPDPKALALLSFRLAEAFLAAEKETPRARAAAEALAKSTVNLDDVDLSGVFGPRAKS